MALKLPRISGLDLIAMAIMSLAPFALLGEIPDPEPRALRQPEAELRCLKGTCFVLPQEGNILLRLPVLKTVKGYFLDKVLTMDENSELEIVFPDKSKLIIRNTSLLEIQKGRGSVLRELERGSNSLPQETDPSKPKEQAPQSIIYVGNLPIEILYPLSGSEVIPESFPAKLRVTFRAAPQLQSLEDSSGTDFSAWNLYKISVNAPPRYIREFRFETGQIPRHYSTELVVDEAGEYLLTPKGLDPGLSYNGFRLRVSHPKELGTRIQDLLDNYETSQDKPLELRSE